MNQTIYTAILIKPGSESKTTETTYKSKTSLTSILGCDFFEPYCSDIKKLQLKDGRIIEFDLFVNEEAGLKDCPLIDCGFL